ncbi:hypothetical protein OH77DRAFT_1405003 [Trametes cingulata]|nr:hypothetical protein OH77DRAFT_1405003 [Trametes cingulata]
MLLSEAAVFSTSFEAVLYGESYRVSGVWRSTRSPSLGPCLIERALTLRCDAAGLSVFLFILTLWVLLRNRKTRRVNWGMVCASTALLALSTMEMTVNIVRLYEGFVRKGPRWAGGPEQYFGDVSQASFVLKNALYNAQTLILDGVVIFRTYKVWNSVLVVAVPILGFMGLLGAYRIPRRTCSVLMPAFLASSVGLCYSLATTPTVSEDLFEVHTSHWLTGNWGMTLVTNICSTLALAYRIWQVTSKSTQYREGGRLSPILRIIVESGALYSLTVTAALVLFLVRSNGVYVVLDMISPIICIVFNMIIVRVGLAADGSLLPQPTEPVPAPSHEVMSLPGPALVRRMLQHRPSESHMEMKDINIRVEIAQYVEGAESRFSREEEEGEGEGRKSERIGSPVTSVVGSGVGISVAERAMSPISLSPMSPVHSGSQIHVVAL